MTSNQARIATITDPHAVALVRRLRRLMELAEATLYASALGTLVVPEPLGAASVLACGLAALALLELRRSVVGRLRALLGQEQLSLEDERQWLRLGHSASAAGAWSFDLSRDVQPHSVLIVPAVMAAVGTAVTRATNTLPAVVGVGLLHLLAAAVLDRRGARHRFLQLVPWLGGFLAADQLARLSTEEQTRATAGVLLLLVPVAAMALFSRPIWHRVRTAPNMRWRLATLAKADGTNALLATLPLLVMTVALVFAYSRGLVLSIASGVAVGLAARLRRPAAAVAAGVVAVGVVLQLNPPRDRGTGSVMGVALLAVVLAGRHLWPQPWLVASVAAGACHLLAVRPPVGVLFALVFAFVAAMPRVKAPAARATEASEETKTAYEPSG